MFLRLLRGWRSRNQIFAGPTCASLRVCDYEVVLDGIENPAAMLQLDTSLSPGGGIGSAGMDFADGHLLPPAWT